MLGGFGPDPMERAIDVDQTNRSVIVDERVIVKWFVPPVPVPHIGTRLVEHLTEVGFPHMPSFRGVEVVDGAVRAIMTDFVPGSTDGWEWCVDEMLDVVGGQIADEVFVSSARGLGSLTAALHGALATPSTVIREPVRRSAVAPLHSRAVALLTDAEIVGSDAARRVVQERRPEIESVIDGLGEMEETIVQPIHADLHVGQILRAGPSFFVVDFDGNPLVGGGPTDSFAPAAVDVASLLQSIDHVGRVATRRRRSHRDSIETLVEAATSAALSSYLDGLRAMDRSELFDPQLLAPLRAVQELHEMVYADRHLKGWMYVPLEALRSMFPLAPSSTTG